MDNQAKRRWTSEYGRAYDYYPHVPAELAGLDLSKQLDHNSVFLLSEASAALAELPALPTNGIGAVLYRSEAAASSLIEGEVARPRRILEVEAAYEDEVSDPAALRIVSNLEVLRDAVAAESDLTVEDVNRWHGHLLAGYPERFTIGAFRTSQNWIGGTSAGPEYATFIPPPPELVPALMVDLMQFARNADFPALAQAAVVHAQFETIHPYDDGNGRIGRVLMLAVFNRRRAEITLPPISRVWYRRQADYINSLNAFRDGGLNQWISFVGETMIEAIDDARQLDARLSSLTEQWMTNATPRRGSVAERLIADFAVHPVNDSESVARRYDVSTVAARKALIGLESDGVVIARKLSRRKRGQPRILYTASGIVELLDYL